MTERWVWRNFGLSVPSDWEMLQFSRSADAGRCVFADRYQFRLEFDWRVVPGPPDFDRMMSDYLAQLQEDGLEQGTRFGLDDWHGVRGVAESGPVTRLGRHFPAESCLAELVFLWPKRADDALLADIARSVAVEPCVRGSYRRWRAFGMDLLADGALELDACDVQPAMAEMTFADAKHRRRERFGRRGMVKEWLKQPLAAWLRSWVGGELRNAEASEFDAGGHDVHRLAWTGRTGALRRPVRCEATAWICPRDKRLYSVVAFVDPGGAVAGGRLSCCDGLGLELPS